MVDCMLFDLDGTLVDTAPDLAGALTRMRQARGQAAVDVDELRRHVSAGSPAMLRFAFGLEADAPELPGYLAEFFRNYEAASFVHSRLFDGMADVLVQLDTRRLPWGLVTNKDSRFASPLVAGLGLQQRARCLVYADTTPHIKPHPGPLLHAAALCGVEASRCVYVGDDPRDVQAGRAAGMRTIAVTWGYASSDPHGWGADDVISKPGELLKYAT